MNGLTRPGLVMRIKESLSNRLNDSIENAPLLRGVFNRSITRVLKGFLLLLRAPFLPAGCVL